MSKFSLKNGLLMTYAHLIKDGGDSQMWFGFIIFLLPAVAFFESGFIYSILWCIGTLTLLILCRCWDDPYELGWLEKSTTQSIVSGNSKEKKE